MAVGVVFDSSIDLLVMYFATIMLQFLWLEAKCCAHQRKSREKIETEFIKMPLTNFHWIDKNVSPICCLNWTERETDTHTHKQPMTNLNRTCNNNERDKILLVAVSWIIIIIWMSIKKHLAFWSILTDATWTFVYTDLRSRLDSTPGQNAKRLNVEAILLIHDQNAALQHTKNINVSSKVANGNNAATKNAIFELLLLLSSLVLLVRIARDLHIYYNYDNLHRESNYGTEYYLRTALTSKLFKS